MTPTEPTLPPEWLKEVKDRHNKATSGPWRPEWFHEITTLTGHVDQIQANMQFIAHARTDLPMLPV